MSIGSFSYTRSGLVSLARSQFRWSSDVTRSDRLKGNLNSELICFVFFVCMDYLGCYQHLVKIKSTAPLEIYLLGKMVFNTYFTAVCACGTGLSNKVPPVHQ